MEEKTITAVGIDVSKAKSIVTHTTPELKALTETLRGVGGDIRVVMEHTGMYWRPIALVLKEAGFFVSIVNAMPIHDFSDNSIRRIKTDRADSLKIANCALTFWQDLRDYTLEDENRQMPKTQSRLYERTLDQTYYANNIQP